MKKADITFAAHCHNVNVLLSNISLFDFWHKFHGAVLLQKGSFSRGGNT